MSLSEGKVLKIKEPRETVPTRSYWSQNKGHEPLVPGSGPRSAIPRRELSSAVHVPSTNTTGSWVTVFFPSRTFPPKAMGESNKAI